MPTGKFSGDSGTVMNTEKQTVAIIHSLQYAFPTQQILTCTVHLINDGVTVNGNTATVEFASSGPATTFQCSLDNWGFSACELLQVTYIAL